MHIASLRKKLEKKPSEAELIDLVDQTGQRYNIRDRFDQVGCSGTHRSRSYYNLTMALDLDDTISLLARTPITLNTLLRDQPEIWTQRNEGENTWSAYDVIGHLAHGERADWIPRVKCILLHGDSQAFEPFDRFAQVRESQGKSLSQLLDEFSQLRAENLATVRAMNLQPGDLERRGLHPSLGPVTMSQLIATWAAHDMTHLHQISRILAYQYRETVGPWSQYLGVLQCAGHSS
jgi:hypothetical protein